ncbi:hypothetical protein [Hymenobacter glacialis]|uniref:Uncharacterized protein n=1 Tax=Hymenobacter glacialis TaxID=1908236 RepID=A0A1G1SZ05_9BACT|nr:hypothetical protein [Hymenobacter glacialis]OGX83841.1 hypothetical protein BEN48_03505 [Hymenobacter glacialis]
MLARHRFLLLFLTLLATSSCSKKTAQEQATEMVQTDNEEIDPYSNLVFAFDEAVVANAQLNRRDTTQYMR